MTSIAESHSPKHQPQRSPNPGSGGVSSGRRRSTERGDASTNMQQTGTSSGSRYIMNTHNVVYSFEELLGTLLYK